MPDEKSHKVFLGLLRKSDRAVERVKCYLEMKGYKVRKLEMTEAPTLEKWNKHSDKGDLTVEFAIEVKHSGADFTSLDDWPHKPYFIVDGKKTFDRKKPKPYAYMVTNNNLTHVAIVFPADYKSWYVQERTAKGSDGQTKDFYFSPLDLVRWRKI